MKTEIKNKRKEVQCHEPIIRLNIVVTYLF